MRIFFIVVVFTSSFASGHTDPQDENALKILYESLKSPSLPGWNINGGDPCGDLWHGVVCSGHNIIAIRLTGLKLRGSLGDSLNKFTSLLTLDLSNNHIGELLPFQFPSRLVQLNLGNNVFIGTIPYSLKRLMSLTNLNLSKNFLYGDVPDIFDKLTNLQTLDISNNNFTGQLPISTGSLSSLSTLHIQQNELNGSVDVLTKLPLKDLNIENNNFTGAVPAKLRSLPIFRGNGNHFNNMSGGLPQQSPRHKSLKQDANQSTNSLNPGKLAGIVAGGILAVLIFTFLIFTLIHKRKNMVKNVDMEFLTKPKLLLPPGPVKEDNVQLPSSPAQKPPPPETRLKSSLPSKDASIQVAEYSYQDLQAATGSFSTHNLIGEGLLGRVYKGEFSNGKIFAIKKLESSNRHKNDELLKIVSNIAKLHHENILELVGYCVENGQCVLVYPYFSNGALNDLLHAQHKKVQLDWNQRMRISLGAARALEYLHEVCVPTMVHRNFKSANILLDEEFNPYVSDSGLAAFVPFGTERQISAQMLGSFGYSAPEYALSGTYTAKSDVYSFGVVMLELLTGRQPFDSSKPRSREQSLVSWANPQLKDIDSLAKIIDTRMEGMYPAKSLLRYAELISQCIQVEPEARPAMSEVVQSLVGLMKRSGVLNKSRVSREYETTGSLERSFEHQNV